MSLIKLLAALTLTISISLSGCTIFDFHNAGNKVEIFENVSYVSRSKNSRHLMDLFIPRGKQDYPTVIFVHGGYWNSQDKSYYRAFTGLYGNIGIALARRGIGAVITDYRINPEVKIDGELEDVLNSVKWTINNIGHYRGNPAKLVLAGHSAGGHIISLIGVNPELYKTAGIDPSVIKGYVALSPILDLQNMEKENYPDFNNSTTYPVFGKSQEELIKYSPLTYFKPGMPPFMIMYGQNDYPFLKHQVKDSIDKLRRMGNTPETLEVRGYTHEDMVLNFGKSDDKIIEPFADFVFNVIK